MIFENFKQKKKYKPWKKYMSKQGTYEVMHDQNMGPYFADFTICDDDDKSYIRSGQPQYNLPKMELTGMLPYDDYEMFSIVEYEVYYIENPQDSFAKQVEKERGKTTD